MTADTVVIHAPGRCPTPDSIREQRLEQMQAIRILRGVLGESHITVSREERGYLRRLSRARGLPAR